jgi:hypothetical protein
MRRLRRLSPAAVVLAALAGPAGCDTDNDQSRRQPVSAVIGLDFTRNAVHGPI